MAFTLFTALLVPASAAAKEDWNHPMGKEWYLDLARCETGNSTARVYPLNPHSSYVSYFGIYKRTWDFWNDTPARKVHKLSFGAQARGVDRIAFYGHTENGQRRGPAGLYGWGAIRHNCNGLNDQLCKSNHPVVIKKRRCK